MLSSRIVIDRHSEFRVDAVRAVSVSSATADRGETGPTGRSGANTTEKRTAAFAAIRLRRSIADSRRFWQFACRT